MRNFGHRAARWVAVVHVAFVVAAALGSAGAWLAWRDATPLPSDQRAGEIATEVLPGATIGEIERWDVTFGDQWPDMYTRLIGDDEYDGGSVLVPVPVADIAAVRETLTRNGWQILPNSGTERLSDVQTVEYVTARRDDVEMAVFHDSWDNGEGIVFQHPQPTGVRRYALAGGLSGLLVGAPAAILFTAGHRGRRRWNAPAWAGGALLALPSLAAVTELISPTAPIPPDVPGAPWEGYVIFKLLTVLGVLGWARAVALRARRDDAMAAAPR